MKNKGLTFIELLITVLVISLLWIMMVRIFEGRIRQSKIVICNFQVTEINSKIDQIQAVRGYRIASQKELEKILSDKKHFQRRPLCPFGLPYTLSLRTHLVFYHKH